MSTGAAEAVGATSTGSPAASLFEPLLAAIVRADGDALVMHAGERPYVVAPSGMIELSTKTMTLEALGRVLTEALPDDVQRTLEEEGAIEHELAGAAPTGDRFNLVAARDAHDLWVEVRRFRRTSVPGGPTESLESAPGLPPVAAREPVEAGPSLWDDESADAVVAGMPLERSTARLATRAGGPARVSGLDRLLRLAAAEGASTLYLSPQSRPLVRVEADIVPLEGERILMSAEVEALLLEWTAEAGPEAMTGDAGEWTREVPDLGRVRYTRFRDHRGTGGIVRLISTKVLTADQLGLAREIQALSSQADGLVLVAGQRLSGKSTLVGALVDLVNRTRSDHIIVLQGRIKAVHESRRAFLSQREVSGDVSDMVRAVRAALREDPDVLVIDDLQSAEVTGLALEAAASGRLVMASIVAPSAVAAMEKLLEQFPADRQEAIRRSLASSLRGIVAQALLRKTGGGRLAARELLLNTPMVASLIAEGKLHQLPLAIDGGRRQGMVPLNDALVAFVQSGAIDAREAYRKASDREGLLGHYRRAGVDTSFVDRLA